MRENAPYELQVNMNDCFLEEECSSLVANTVQANIETASPEG